MGKLRKLGPRAGAPWAAFYPDEFLAATEELNPDLCGYYIRILAHQLARDSYFPSDPKVGARLVGARSAKAFAQITAQLVDHGLLRGTPDGFTCDLADRALEQRAKASERNRNNVMNRWHADKNGNNINQSDVRPYHDADTGTRLFGSAVIRM